MVCREWNRCCSISCSTATLFPEQLDPERPLSPAGRREVEAVVHLFASTGARVMRVAHSGKLRAQQTAELLATALAPGTVPEVMVGLNPNDPVEPMVRRIADWTSDVVLVGHLPFMAKLVARLVAGDERNSHRLRPGDGRVPRAGRGGPLAHLVDGAARARTAPELSCTGCYAAPRRCRMMAEEDRG
jgi:phosphohistidine phosphatase SixA